MGLLWACIATLPVSIALTEPCALAAAAVWVLHLVKTRRSVWSSSPFRIPFSAFVVVVLLSSLWSVEPAISVSKFHKLMLLLIIFMVPDAVAAADWTPVVGARRILGSFVAGAAVLGAYDLVRVPVQAAGGAELFSTGNMRDPQMYLVAVCFALGLLALGVQGRWRVGLYVALALVLCGLVLHFKRGVWLSAGFAVCLMGVLLGRRRILVAAMLCAVALLFVPQVRERLALTRQSASSREGGRFVLWTQVAPALLRAYPQGMGWCAVTHEGLSKHARYVQPGLNHLHNNPLQIALELGWLGLAVWLAWMGEVVAVFIRCAKPPGIAGAAIAGLGAFTGLMLNGLVEYNFGDTEIMMTLAVVMGLAGVLASGATIEAQANVHQMAPDV